jgi:hypothetical protein
MLSLSYHPYIRQRLVLYVSNGVSGVLALLLICYMVLDVWFDFSWTQRA